MELFADNTIKAKAKATKLGVALQSGDLAIGDLIDFAQDKTGKDKATCIEGIEYATKNGSRLTNDRLLDFLTDALQDDEPRVKWESAHDRQRCQLLHELS